MKEKPVKKLKPNDITSLLMGDGGNTYNHGAWSIFLEKDAGDTESRLASLHESLHGDLNDSTAYGVLLMTIAYLARNSSDESTYPMLLGQLVSFCRKTHESFATTISSLVIGDDISQEIIANNYPNYIDYLKIGSSLGNPFNGKDLRYHAICSSLRICMQSLAVERAIDVGLDKFSASDVLSMNRPDNRLTMLRRLVRPQFWNHALEKARAQAPHLLGWDVLEESEQTGSTILMSMDEKYDALSAHIMQSFTHSLTSLLSDRGYSSIEYDGQIRLAPQLLKSAYQLIPLKEESRDILRTAENEDNSLLPILQFANEHIILHDQRLNGRFTKFSVLKNENIRKFSAGDPPNEHLFIAVRPADRILNQLDLPEDEHISLSQYKHDPIVVLQHSALDRNGIRIVERFILDKPEELNHLSSLNIPIVASISLFAVGTASWSNIWYSAIAKISKVTLLLDLPPHRHLIRWAKNKLGQVKIGVINTKVDNRDLIVFAISPSANSPIILAPCSSIVASSLTYISRQLPHGSIIECESFLYEQQWLLQVTLGHLFREEQRFDFEAGRGVTS